ncbi:MAG: FAD-dependent oxidoreductase, partial [Pseudomonadota bacterium]
MKRHVIVVGGGIAGASAALRLADAGVAVTLFTKTPLAVSASQWAQGGIAAALAADDDWRAHARDTLDAGAGLADAGAARHSAAAAPAMIAWLEGLGIAFTRRRDGKALHLTREAGHGARRIVHADDATGAAVMRVLLERVAAHPRVATLTGHTVIDLLLRDDDAVAGVKTLDPHSGHVAYRGADQVVLACGGAAGLYARSTSAGGATGDGIAMAWRAGCRVANLEYVQFHPTCLHVDAPGQPPLLISEAVRGEGGVLRRADGTRFM